MTQAIEIRPLRQSDGVHVPGPSQAAQGAAVTAPQVYLGYDPTHIRLTDKVQVAGFLIGNVACNRGDVIQIDKPPKDAGGNPLPWRPGINVMTIDRARNLLKLGLAEPHHGPATKRLSNPTLAEVVSSIPAEVERADLAAQIDAAGERATARPQRRGAI